ncbi:hypothetical protein TraAM80_01975 [Trypanosoma rangeli]|uniref:B30.2/SPRY domain-containing protein n=1 Tax=Trypanosoma rangeli TaxID=5698 RepID=A0A422NWM1_TRYRA|nr:uncharacterized protein TraAM80_01975 [Trypanosoma rangeli]RNF09923.1 hypothetical protein TraAM80_01975 [Trypanosoma rangeli]|eukprot:RNF09923.1 hypothetical protein TraAM80_01975 [Trypanosoma rangeli]
MFYSGWKFPTPQRIVVGEGQHGTNHFVQETSSPGICLIHFLSSNMRLGPSASAANNVARREGNGRIHLKSDVPIHPYSGVFYFEVEVRSVAAAAGGDGRSFPPSSAEPELVIGICHESLPQHALPGEDSRSVGLFTAQRMAYINGKGEGEAVRFPTGARYRSGGVAEGSTNDHRARGMKVGDTVGCIVNLMDGTVRFTFNGELLDVVATLSRRMPRHGYYPAVGMFRLLPAVCLRVVFPPLGGSASVPRPAMTQRAPLPPPAAESAVTATTNTNSAAVAGLGSAAAAAAAFFPRQETRTTAAGYFLFNVDRYCEGIADELVRLHQQKIATDIQNEGEEGAGCSCRDASIMAVIRKHLAARGMTKALSAFEKERKELHCATATASPLQEGKTVHNPEKAHATRSEENTKKNLKHNLQRRTNVGLHTNLGGKVVDEESQTIAYSLHIQQLREDIGRGDMFASTQRILITGVISPTMRNKISAVMEDVNRLPSDFWGTIFFAQRRDILFLLRAAHLVEVTLGAMEEGLAALRSRLAEREEPNRGATFEAADATSTKAPLTTAELMKLAFHILLEPFDAVSAAARHYQCAPSAGVRTGDAVAFGMLDEAFAKRESGWVSDDLAAHLFFKEDKALWSGPEAPITLLVRRSVPNIPPPKPKHQRRIVQTLSMLLSHQRAVCTRAEEPCYANASLTWAEDWLLLLQDAKVQYRATCWRLLLHAIEEFNGALECRLLSWISGHEEEMQKAEKGGGLGQRGATAHRHEGVGGRLFPSLRSAWRHVHAAAALEPLLNIVTKAFSDRLHRASTSAQLATMATQNNTSSYFEKGPKRGLSFPCVFMDSEQDEDDMQPGEAASELASTSAANHGSHNSRSADACRRVSCYNDDVRLSFMYMKSIYKAAFA